MNSTLCSCSRSISRLKAASLLLLLVGLPIATRAQFNFTTNNGSITIVRYTGAGGDAVIPDTTNGLKVTSVETAAFYQVSALNSVTFGTNVTVIGTNAIFQCPTLASVIIPGSVTNIGTGPFLDCQSLTTISFSSSNSNYSVTNNVLFNKALTSLIEFPGGVPGTYLMPAAVTNVGQAFIGNTLSAIVVTNANTIFSSTNGVLFNKNKSQLISYPGALGGSYAVPTNVTTIVSASFEYSPAIASVSIGTNVTSIGSFAFYDCTNLTSISVNATNKFYSTTNGVLFDKNKTVLIQFPSGLGGSYIIPNTVTNIGDGAFGDAFGLTSVVIPNSVTNIGFEAFYSCVGLASVSIGNHVKNIADAAFFFCPELTSVVIPGSVTNLGFEAFSNCGKLASVCFQGSPPVDGGSVFFFDQALTTILYVSGNSGWGATYDGIATTPCTTCEVPAPRLTITPAGANVILTWPDTFSGYSLESTTNPIPPVTWSAASPLPTDISGQNTVTNSVTGRRKFYRLIQ